MGGPPQGMGLPPPRRTVAPRRPFVDNHPSCSGRSRPPRLEKTGLPAASRPKCSACHGREANLRANSSDPLPQSKSGNSQGRQSGAGCCRRGSAEEKACLWIQDSRPTRCRPGK